MTARAAGILAGVVIAAFLAFAVHELPRYGPTFDAVLGEYPYGEDFVAFWSTLDRDHLRFEQPPPHSDEPGHPAWKRVYPLSWIYPLGATLSALGCAAFSRHLHWLDAVDGHHLVCPISFVALLWIVFAFVRRRLGDWSALAAVLGIALQPRLLGEAMNNVKDAPTLPLFFGALFLFARALETSSRRAVVLALVVTGVGLAQKINALWPLLLFGLVFVVARGLALVRRDRASWQLVFAGVSAVPLVLAAYFVCAPQYLVDPLPRLADHWIHRTVEATHVVRDSWSFEPLQNFAITTPPMVLALALVGLVAIVRSRRLAPTTLALLLLVLVIPPLRPCMPGMRYFNVVRHFLESLVVTGILAGHGAAVVIAWRRKLLASPLARGVATSALAAAFLAPESVAIARCHPFETTYYNDLVGGLGGAQARGLRDANDYWCQSYREGIRWLNEHAEPNAWVIVPVAPWIVAPVAKNWLREDLAFNGDEGVMKSLIDRGLADPNRNHAEWSAKVNVVYVMEAPLTLRYVHNVAADLLRWCENDLKPIHVIESDGGEILRFYRFEP